jgi:hypothetical protein
VVVAAVAVAVAIADADAAAAAARWVYVTLPTKLASDDWMSLKGWPESLLRPGRRLIRWPASMNGSLVCAYLG